MLYKKCLEEGGLRGIGLWLVCLCGYIAVFTVAAWIIYGKFEFSLREELWGACFILGLAGTAAWIILVDRPGSHRKPAPVANRAVAHSGGRRDQQTHEDGLIEAIRRHDHRRLAKLIRRRSNPDEPDANGMTPIMHAARALNYRGVRMLAKAGVDLQAFGPGNRSLWHFAGEYPQNDYQVSQQKKIYKFLKAKDVMEDRLGYQIVVSVGMALAGESPDRMPAGPEALSYAAYSGNLRALHALLQAGVDPNTQDSDGRTAAHHAASEGRKNVLCALAACGADFSIKDESGSIVTAAALSGKHKRLARWVVRQMDT